MRTADLTDLSDLISGWHRVATETEHIDEPEHMEFSVEVAVSAVDAVTRVYSDAAWTVTGDCGRIVAGDVLVSLAVSLTGEGAASRWMQAPCGAYVTRLAFSCCHVLFCLVNNPSSHPEYAT